MLTNTISENIKIIKRKISRLEIKKTLGITIIKNILNRSRNLVNINSFDHKKMKNEEKVNF